MPADLDTVDEDGFFIFGRQLNGQGGANTITSDQIDDNLPQWIHLDYSHEKAPEWLRSQNVDDSIIDTLLRAESRPRAIVADSSLVLVLRGVNTNPGADPEDMVSVRILFESNRVITVRQRKLFSAQDVKSDVDKGIGPRTLSELLVTLIEKIADRIEIFVVDMDDQMESAEESVEASSPLQLRAEITNLRRQAATVRRFLAPQRDALETLYRVSDRCLNDDERYIIREQSDRITRYVEDLDLLRERALLLQEELMNKVAQEQNSRMYVLSVVAAIFLPITFLTGIFGMNVAGLPGTEDIRAFWVLSGSMFAIAIGVLIVLRRKRWF